jgi:ribosomal subunit interface protein
METTITAQGLGVTDRFREYATEKSQKIEALADRAIAFEIKLTRHHTSRGSSGDDRVELTIVGPGPLVRAEAAGADKYVAFDLAVGKLVERIRQANDRRKVHRGQHKPASLHEVSAADFRPLGVTPADSSLFEQVRTGAVAVVDEPPLVEEDEVYCPVVIRTKVFASAPMTVDDALYYMELVGHDFYLFVDSETERPSVVYRRKGWDYGVIALDDDADELQEVATAARAMR